MTSTVPAIGIDLGTTYCCVGVYHNGRVQIIPNQEDSGDYTTPSYVFFDPDGDEIVGKQAKQNAFRNPENTIYDVKRILGRTFDDPELQKDMQYWPFTVQENNSVPKVKVCGKLLYPEQISAKLLTKLRITADDFLSLDRGTIKKAVITVPAYFNDGQRQATIDAGELAGLEVLSILNEPTAAAIAYSVERMDGKVKKVLVFDLGGGTFDVAVLNIEKTKIDVLGVNGDTHLGGEDFDKNTMEYCVSCFKTETGLNLLDGKDSTNYMVREKTRRNLRRLQTYCKNAKQYLTAGMKAKVAVDAILDGEDLVVDISRSKFEELNKSLFAKTVALVDATLKELKLSKTDIDDVVLVGGSTRIPKIQDLLKSYFDGKSLNNSIHPDQAMAYGAAVKAAMMTGEKSIGPLELSQIQDVTPMSIGIETLDGNFSIILPKNTKFPVKKIQMYSTFNDAVSINIYQGEIENTLLGVFVLGGIPIKKPREENIDVSMEIDAMGILHVEAVCRSTSGRSTLTVSENKNRMSKELKKNLASKENGVNIDNIPESMLEAIISRLPPNDILNCNLVCRAWKDLITRKSFWKCCYDLKDLDWTVVPSHIRETAEGWMFIFALYRDKIFTKNYIYNPSGHAQLAGWTVNKNAGGCDPLPLDPFFDDQYCFVTSFEWCSKQSVVDLWEQGLNPKLMRYILPLEIKCQQRYSTRFYCGGLFVWELRILDSQEKIIRRHKVFMDKPPSTKWKTLSWSFIFKFSDDDIMNQVRYLVFIHEGKNSQFWSGHYGMKFCARASVTVQSLNPMVSGSGLLSKLLKLSKQKLLK